MPWKALIGPATTLIGGLIQGNGAKDAASQANQGNNAAIAEQRREFDLINNQWAPQRQLGYGADALMGKLQKGDYSNFYDSPGYQYALQKGTQATNRNAAASGNLFSSNTLAAVGANNIGIASKQYGDYVNQLMGMAGLGNSAIAGTARAAESVGNNISQADINKGNANASGVASNSSAWGNAVNSIGGQLKNVNWGNIFGSGASPAADGLGVTGTGLDALGSGGTLAEGGAVSGSGGLGSGATLGGSMSDALSAGSGAGTGIGGGGSSIAGIGGGGGEGVGGGTGGLGDAAASADAGGGLLPAGGSALGGAIGAAVPLGIAAFGASTQPYNLKGSWWQGLRDGLKPGPSGNAAFDKQTPPDIRIYNSKEGLYHMLMETGGGGNLTKNDFGSGGNAIPADLLALAKSYGMFNADGSFNRHWSQLYPVSARYSAYGKLLPTATNTYIDPNLPNGYTTGGGGTPGK